MIIRATTMKKMTESRMLKAQLQQLKIIKKRIINYFEIIENYATKSGCMEEDYSFTDLYNKEQ